MSKTLQEVLSDKAATGYFIQFLESRHASAYYQCWLDVQNFKDAVHHLKENGRTSSEDLHSSCQSGQVDHDSLSVSTDCDSYTADSNSLCDFSSAPTVSESKLDMDTSKNDKDKLDIISVCDRVISDNSFKDFKHTLREQNGINCNNKTTRTQQNIVDSALSIFKKYVALEANENVKCSEDLRKEIIENICNTDRTLDVNCFEKVQVHVIDVMEKEYFQVFLTSDYFCKHQIDVLTGGNVILEDILYNETALFYFMEFLEQENHRNLLEFWLAATNFQQQLHDQKQFVDPIEAQNDAVVLYDKYFSLQAHCPLGFSDKVRFAVEQNICGENGLILDCFHLPLKIVEQVLEKNYLKSFLASQLFYKYLSELISTVQSYGYSNSFDNDKRSPSDCSSEKSFSTNSTFLAMENPNKSKKQVTNMSIDTRQLYDPDSLWKRRKTHRLSFGRVTDMGKFETDFEPEPDKKHQSKLKNVVRRFVNLNEEDKRKEEMAWQIAEMIVKDITNITLSENPFQS